MVAMAVLKMTEKVVVFIPPPVEPGEAPMNIKNRNDINTGCEREAISTVLNPAVLLVID